MREVIFADERFAVEGATNLAVEDTTNLAVECTTNLAVEGTTNLAVEGTTNLAVEGTTNLAVEGTTNLALYGNLENAEISEEKCLRDFADRPFLTTKYFLPQKFFFLRGSGLGLVRSVLVYRIH